MAEFAPTLASLLDYECPTWFRDAKFDIYPHWGPYSVVERGERYVRHLYNVRALACDEGIGPIAEVTLLGGDGALRWGQDQDMLRIVIPEALPCGHALSFRVEFADGAA
ncbi:MAG TPA: alpha-L-fucosidase [Planctomycetota bacterium]|nr:alpha-L-fucosidase [Planctomycetota bacterium]